MLRTAHAADVARYAAARHENGQADALAGEAARADRAYKLALAEVALARAEQKLALAPQADREKAAKEVEQSRAERDKAQAAQADPGSSYTSLQASLKALFGPAESDAERRRPYPATSTGRRGALARWITDPLNPLTARVAVNHLWLRHFGQPLVDPVTDFGRRTPRPPQHELLDWLAVELMENQWSMKHLHRLIVTSQAYRLDSASSAADPETVQRDPANQYYWRRMPMRMESQLVRDSLLQLAGQLNPQLGGPSIKPQPDDTAGRRSLYFIHSRDDRQPFLAMFDDADILACYRRSESIVPQQALTLSNSKFAMTMARSLADRLGAGDSTISDEQFTERAFEVILCRQAEPSEREACLEAVRQMRELLAARPADEATRRVRQNLIHALLNHNDFITIR
ncbi:MAG: DUF1553 domain-containing protein, partial [Pirellulaceae bacterium]|nr:DUF1553 domain-containing protein [Pirellulaceae bacterium]